MNVFDCTIVPVEVRNNPAFLSECILSNTNCTNGLLFSSYATASASPFYIGFPDIFLQVDQYPEPPVNQRKAECDDCTPLVPREWYRANPFKIQHSNCCREHERKQGQYPQVQDEGLSKNKGITDILKHIHATVTVPLSAGWIMSS